MTRNQYDHEFKVRAVKLITEQGYSFQQASESLGVNEQTLRNWVKRFRPDAENGQLIDREAELRTLREENRRLRMEREILKKATAFFAKEHP